ncbi:MAG: DsrE family protein, partial [Gammaproteobacteria bacterium]|nr:DsrE family protein [Gammaproteobacteria bacterium]
SGSRGTDDPTMATLPFIAAKTAKEQGNHVVLWLWNEAVVLARTGVAEHVVGVNLTPLKDLLAAIQSQGIPIWVCGACAVARQVSEAELVAGSVIKGMPDYITAVAERDRNIMF